MRITLNKISSSRDNSMLEKTLLDDFILYSSKRASLRGHQLPGDEVDKEALTGQLLHEIDAGVIPPLQVLKSA